MHQHSHEPFVPLVPIVKGEGVWLIDADGNRYIDAISSWWTNLFGHANPHIANAIKAQVDTLEHVMLAGFTHPPAVRLAERLAVLTGLPHIFFASDGASAVEIALKMAFHFHANRDAVGTSQRTRFIALSGSYHGETIGALGVTDVAIFRDSYAPLIASPILIDGPQPANISLDHACCNECVAPAIERLRAVMEEHGKQVAAMIVEPLVQGAAGMRMTSPLYLQQAKALCEEYGVLFIADEIMTGFGRTGTMFACEQASVTPDLMCLSKGLTGGFMALSAVAASKSVFDAFDSPQVTRGFLHSHSYTGNPLACAAANATLDIFEREDVLVRNRERAHVFTMQFQRLAGQSYVRSARHLGMIWACEIEHPAAYMTHFARNVFAAALKQGVVIRPIGNTVYLLPPYCIDEDQFTGTMDGVLSAIELALTSVASPAKEKHRFA
jgi:adenosylmethionine---8-amino-7-oxononanoate aminotransferase